MNPIPIPVTDDPDWWAGTTGVTCTCGGKIEWAEAAYVSGTRACRSCLVQFRVRGDGAARVLWPQTADDEGIISDAGPDDELYRVPADLYPGWHDPK